MAYARATENRWVSEPAEYTKQYEIHDTSG